MPSDISHRPIILPVFAAIFVLLLAGTPVVRAHPATPDRESSPTIAVQTQGATVPGCAATRVEIWARDIAGLYGIDVRVTFDPNALQVLDADPVMAGVQITPLANFLKPDFVVKKAACNTGSTGDPNCAMDGLIWYAATQTAPTPAASGSGALAAIDFVGANAGLTSLQITYSEPVDIHGNLIAAAIVNAELNVGPPASPATAISLPAPNTVRLTWGAVPGAIYRVYRNPQPYFAPEEPPYASTALLAYDDIGAAGAPEANHFYIIKSGCNATFFSQGGNRTGEFDFALSKP